MHPNHSPPTVTQSPPPTRRLASTLLIGAHSGWGVYGCNLALQAVARKIQFVPVGPCDWDSLEPGQRSRLASIQTTQKIFQEQLTAHLSAKRQRQIGFDGDVLHCLGNDLSSPPLDFLLQGKRNFGTLFLEDSHLTPDAVASGKTLQKIIAGSTWNGQVLKNHGLTNSAVVLQGIDPGLFSPAPKQKKWGDRFVIFSGGKLEYRKGQDLVIAAFAKFSRKHPDVLLVFAWHNNWPKQMSEIGTAHHVQDAPLQLPDQTVDFTTWLHNKGLQNFIDLGQILNWQSPEFLREADVALFPNRAEGGTNLVAMEAMACGIPTILSANTGHLDLIEEENCYPLQDQKNVQPTQTYPNVEGWGESSVGEILENLERVFQNRDEAKKRGLAGAQSMAKLSWETQIDKLLAEMS
jgi:glycosyltransferase involved in cell wall biosynthesis